MSRMGQTVVVAALLHRPRRWADEASLVKMAHGARPWLRCDIAVMCCSQFHYSLPALERLEIVKSSGGYLDSPA